MRHADPFRERASECAGASGRRRRSPLIVRSASRAFRRSAPAAHRAIRSRPAAAPRPALSAASARAARRGRATSAPTSERFSCDSACPTVGSIETPPDAPSERRRASRSDARGSPRRTTTPVQDAASARRHPTARRERVAALHDVGELRRAAAWSQPSFVPQRLDRIEPRRAHARDDRREERHRDRERGDDRQIHRPASRRESTTRNTPRRSPAGTSPARSA